MGFVRNLSLLLARFSLAAWVGAAVLFVVTSVHEQRSEQFSGATRSHLALLRFPDYYVAGFSLVGTALVTAVIARNHPTIGAGRMKFCLVMILVALLLMLVDYFLVYQPLREMLSQGNTSASGRSASDFTRYHNYSKYVNELDVSLCLIAAFALTWSGGGRGDHGDGHRASRH